MSGAGRDTVPGLVEAALRAGPDAPAIILGGRRVALAELDAVSRRVARGLSGMGVGAGDLVALWLPNGIEWLALYLACQRLGAVALAVNTRFRRAEIEDILGRSGAKVLALAPGFKGIDFAGILAEVAPDAVGTVETLIVCGGGTERLPSLPAVAFETLAAGPPLAGSEARPGWGSVIFTTSGTTAAPKFVLLEQRAIAVHAREVAKTFGYAAGDAVLLQALPLCGTFGHAQAMATIAARRPMVMMPSFDPEEAARLIARHRVTHFNASDEMILRLLDCAGADRLASLRWVGYAAFANTEARALVAAAEARGVTLAGLYGMSEVQALFARQAPDAGRDQRALAGGRPTSAAAQVRVRDPESGRLLGEGEDGELELEGPSMFREYLGDAAATARALTADGFVRTGDLGRLRGDGFQFLTRMGDSLRLGGFLVSPGEIDAWIERHESVAACQTVGVPGARGTVPVAFVVPRPGTPFDENALIAHCAAGLARFKVPARVVPVDAFPVTDSPNGVKIQRGRLREMAQGLALEGEPRPPRRDPG